MMVSDEYQIFIRGLQKAVEEKEMEKMDNDEVSEE